MDVSHLLIHILFSCFFNFSYQRVFDAKLKPSSRGIHMSQVGHYRIDYVWKSDAIPANERFSEYLNIDSCSIWAQFHPFLKVALVY